MTPSPVAIIGAGSIGVAFAVVFATKGNQVTIQDPMPEALVRARTDLADRLDMLSDHGLLAEPPGEVLNRVRFVSNLSAAVKDVALVQECAPERVALKRQLFTDIASNAPRDTVLASSSSAITPGEIGYGLDEQITRRLIVAHPGNPPYLLPIIEVVPTPGTDEDVIARAETLYRHAGMRPIRVRREVEGFVFNRLQGALLREAYCLVRDGVASVDDIDEVVRSGLGPRWSVIGPFETADLNTRGGIRAHAEKLGPAYARMGAERGQNDPWTPDLVDTVTSQRRELLDLDDWDARVRWRDQQLMSQAASTREETVVQRST